MIRRTIHTHTHTRNISHPREIFNETHPKLHLLGHPLHMFSDIYDNWVVQ